MYQPDPNGAGSSGSPALGSAANPATSSISTNISGTQTIRNTPDVAAPGNYGGTNPCAVGASAGVGMPGLGISGGYMWSDPGCERRNVAIILFQANRMKVAVALLCQDKSTREAFMVSGDPCPQDVALAPVAAAQPAPVQAAAVVAPIAAPVTKASRGGFVGTRPAWCDEKAGNSTDEAYHSYYCRS